MSSRFAGLIHAFLVATVFVTQTQAQASAPGDAVSSATPEEAVRSAPQAPAVAVSTEPIIVTVSRKREYVPFVPPWVTGIGHYPNSYYPSAREKSWRRAFEDRGGFYPYYSSCRLHPVCPGPCLGD